MYHQLAFEYGEGDGVASRLSEYSHGDSWAAAVGAIAVPLIQAFGSPTNKQDAERYATAEAWYTRAIAGDSQALCMLAHMGGKRGTGSCGSERPQGFATPEAKAYTEALYQQALGITQGVISPSAPIPSPPQSGGGTNAIATTAGQISYTSSQIASGLGATPMPTPAQQAMVAQQWGMYLAIGAVVLLVGYFALKRR